MQNNKEKHTEIEDQKIDRLLKECLNEDFDIRIPADFADNVIEKIEKRKSIREALLRHLMMSIGLLVIFAFAAAILFYFQTDQATTLLGYVLQFKYPIIFGLLLFIGIQLADSFLLSRTKDQLDENT